MRTSLDHILTSHAGSLPRPDDLIEANRAREPATIDRGARFRRRCAAPSPRSCAIRRMLGIDIPGDGEFGKPMGQRVNYGSWWRYSWQRLGGLELDGPSLYEMDAAALASRRGRADQLWRPPRPHAVRRRLYRSRIPASPPGRGRRRRSASPR